MWFDCSEVKINRNIINSRIGLQVNGISKHILLKSFDEISTSIINNIDLRISMGHISINQRYLLPDEITNRNYYYEPKLLVANYRIILRGILYDSHMHT